MEHQKALPVHMQIANLEHRLAVLRHKRETLLRHGRILKRVVWTVVAVAPFLIIYVAFNAKSDPLPLTVLASLLVLVTAITLWIYRHSTWISAPGPPAFMASNRYTALWPFIEHSIEDGERRLAELRLQMRGSNGPDDPAP